MTAITHEAPGDMNQSRAFGGRTVIAEKMTLSPYTIGRHEKLSHADELMREHGLRYLPVLDGGKLVGVLLQRELHSVEAITGVDSRVDSIGAAMVRETYAVAPGELVADVARTMDDHKFGCAVVIDRGRVVGVLTATDALALHCAGAAARTVDGERLARTAIR